MNDTLKRFLVLVAMIALAIWAYFQWFELSTFQKFQQLQKWVIIQIISTEIFLFVILFEDVIFKQACFIMAFIIVFLIWIFCSVVGLAWYIYAAVQSYDAIEWWVHGLLILFFALALFFIISVYLSIKSLKNVKDSTETGYENQEHEIY